MNFIPFLPTVSHSTLKLSTEKTKWNSQDHRNQLLKLRMWWRACRGMKREIKINEMTLSRWEGDNSILRRHFIQHFDLNYCCHYYCLSIIGRLRERRERLTSIGKKPLIIDVLKLIAKGIFFWLSITLVFLPLSK